MKVPLLLLLLSISHLSCENVFEFSPNEVRLSENDKNLNAKNIALIKAQPQKDTIKFVVTSDSQRFYNELDAFVNKVNTLKNISFVVLNGDISDFGLNKEFIWVNDKLRQLKVPYLGVIGNHDMLANGRLVYKTMFGAENFSFVHNRFKFIFLNANAQETNFDGSIPDLDWLQKELTKFEDYNNAFVFSHIPPFDKGFDPRKEMLYEELLAKNKVSMSIHGHQNVFNLSKPYGDDVEYLITSPMNKRSFVVVSVAANFYRVEQLYF
jgi:hypothetical protein